MQETLLTQRQIADNRTAVLNFLDLNGIKYTLQQHPAVFTMEELAAAGVENIEYILKNLFLRNANGKQHYLAAVCGEKTVDLKVIRAQLGCSALSFASEERLQKHLGLTKGSVSLFGALNDTENTVQVVLDREILKKPLVGAHPNENTATVFLTPQDLITVLEKTGHTVTYIDV